MQWTTHLLCIRPHTRVRLWLGAALCIGHWHRPETIRLTREGAHLLAVLETRPCIASGDLCAGAIVRAGVRVDARLLADWAGPFAYVGVGAEGCRPCVCGELTAATVL